MGFLDRAIRRGISEGIGKAVSGAVTKAVEPKATELANKAANHLDNASETMQNGAQTQRTAGSSLEGAFSNLERAASTYATSAAKNIKVCPACSESTTADKKFCPACGTKLPEQTVAQSLVCTSCGTQNNVGTKFCQQCGEKLPFAICEEQQAAEKDRQELSRWGEYLPQYPVWNCGGSGFCLEAEPDYCRFSVRFADHTQAVRALEQYRQQLIESGFRQAGQYPSLQQLYKKADGICYNADTEHCFEGDSNCITIYFAKREPSGGFDYVKPQAKKTKGFFDLFK